MHTIEELKAAAQRCSDTYAKLANEMFVGCSIPIPVQLDFELAKIKPSAAGQAVGKINVQLNHILLEDNPIEMLNQVITHEIAHLVAAQVFEANGVAIAGHGPEWKEIMRRLGKPPDRYHKFDVTRAKAFFKEHKKKMKNPKVIKEE